MPPDNELPMTNSPEARTESGELKSQTNPILPSDQTSTGATAPDQVTKAAPGTTLLTQEEPKAPEGEKKDGETKKDEKSAAPEKYEAFKTPDGFKLDDKVLGEATTTFRELGLTQEQGQKLVDFYAKNAVEAAQAPFKTWETMNEKWVADVKADPEIGAKLPEVKATISRALDSLNNPALVTEFKQAMDLTGAGNHPAFVKAFYKMAQALTEGKHVAGRSPSPHGQTAPGTGLRTAAQAMYPNNPSSAS